MLWESAALILNSPWFISNEAVYQDAELPKAQTEIVNLRKAYKNRLNPYIPLRTNKKPVEENNTQRATI